MRRLRLLTFVVTLLAALACNDATSPGRSKRAEISVPQHTLVTPPTTPTVSAGGLNTCVLRSDATVFCWGNTAYGRTLLPAELTSVAQLDAGSYFTSCAVKTDGTGICWGLNDFGQATVPSGLTSAKEVSTGWFHTCGLRTDETIVCWGDRTYGQTSVPSGLASGVQLSAGGYHSCALKTDRSVVCWGNSGYGQATVPSGLASVEQVSAGGMHTCALKTDGTVVCWGNNDYGQKTVPDGLASVAQLSAGRFYTCALKTDSTVLCWGSNSYNHATVPDGLNSVAQVSAGGYHTCALKTDLTVVCWGFNSFGQSTVPFGLNLNFATLPPDADAGPTIAALEGTLVSFAGTGSTDPNGSALTYSWNFGDESPPATGSNASHTYTEDGNYTVTLTVSNGSLTNSATTSANIINALPVVGAIASQAAPVPLNTMINASASFTDLGTLDTHSAIFNWGDGTSSPATLTEASGSGSVSAGHIYSTPGVYTVTLAVTDDDGGTGESAFEFAVVFDPAAGFVTGSGWINSPAGAYAADASLSGRAAFGFVSTYQKGATVPSGNTRFQFHAGDFHFRSAAYDWLVIAGPQAKFKGSGMIHGEGDFGFLLSAVDGDVNGGGSTDKFRIKIWDKLTGSVIYDNQMGEADDAKATTAIEAGNIAIHR